MLRISVIIVVFMVCLGCSSYSSISVNSLELKDSRGEVRARLWIDNLQGVEIPRFELLAKDGKITMCGCPDGHIEFIIHDESDFPRIVLKYNKSGGPHVRIDDTVLHENE